MPPKAKLKPWRLIQVAIEEVDIKKATRIAKKEGISRSELIRRFVKEGLK